MNLNYLLALCALLFFSCENSTKQVENDLLWLKRNAFLSDPIFSNKKYQESEFGKYEGLWTCVKTLRSSDGKTAFPKYEDLLFAEGKAWMLDYPCSWNMQSYAEDVHFRNDSIFFSTKDRVYIQKSQIEFRGDTLVISENNYGGESNFYLKKTHNATTLAALKEKEFNEHCFEGQWELTTIGDGASETWAIEDGYLDHVPGTLDFSKTDFFVDDRYLISTNNPTIKFEILEYDRNFSEYYGEESYLGLKELKAIDGIEYHYSYEPIRN